MAAIAIVSVSAALMQLRAKRRRPEESIEGLPDRERTPALVQRCIAQLPDSYREVIVWRDIEELDTEAAARALGIRPEAAKMRFHRARQGLRTLLAKQLSSR